MNASITPLPPVPPYAKVPPKIEHPLTEIGKSTAPVIDAISQWGEQYTKTVKPGLAENKRLRSASNRRSKAQLTSGKTQRRLNAQRSGFHILAAPSCRYSVDVQKVRCPLMAAQHE